MRRASPGSTSGQRSSRLVNTDMLRILMSSSMRQRSDLLEMALLSHTLHASSLARSAGFRRDARSAVQETQLVGATQEELVLDQFTAKHRLLARLQ
jgi:hypothetical protein